MAAGWAQNSGKDSSIANVEANDEDPKQTGGFGGGGSKM